MRTAILAGVAVIIAGAALWYYAETEQRTPEAVLQEESQQGRYMDIETYVKQSISALSPQKEVLGGTFYVTRIEAHGGTGTVYYEDGHNAYVADFTYDVDEAGKPSVRTFVVR
jgi:hypothetical protein